MEEMKLPLGLILRRRRAAGLRDAKDVDAELIG
jgi:hypothetical protein